MEVDQRIEWMEAWQESPIVRHNSFFDTKLWAKQEEILWAVRNHKYIAVRSGNTVGKTHVAAQIVLDYLTIYPDSIVVTTAPGWTQVAELMWREIAKCVQTSKIPIGGELLKTKLELSPSHYAIGISTNDVHRMSGFHSASGHLLAVIDEASGVEPAIWEAIHSLHPHRILAIGNPLEISGDFYDCFSSPIWHKISINCNECVKWQNENEVIPGLTTQEWINERCAEWGPKSYEFITHVLGEFPEEGPDTLISRAWVDKARTQVNNGEFGGDVDSEEDGPRILSGDSATRHGENRTCIGYRYGHTFKEIRSWQGIPVTEQVGILSSEAVRRKATDLVVDADGVGEGLYDVLEDKGLPIVDFHGGYGYKAMDGTKFRNLRSQFYWVISKKFEKGLYSLDQLGDDEFEILKNQLCCIKKKPPDAMGRIQIETKDDLHARGIKSPDYADMFMMSEYAWYMARYSQVQDYSWR